MVPADTAFGAVGFAIKVRNLRDDARKRRKFSGNYYAAGSTVVMSFVENVCGYKLVKELSGAGEYFLRREELIVT